MCFPYGSFITTILKHFKVSFDHKEFFQINEVIDEEVFHNFNIGIYDDGSLFWDVKEPTIPLFIYIPTMNPHIPSDIHSVSPGPFISIPSPTLSELAIMLQDMGFKLDGVLEKFDTISDRVNLVSDRVNTISDRMDEIVACHKALDIKLLDLDKKLEAVCFGTDSELISLLLILLDNDKGGEIGW